MSQKVVSYFFNSTYTLHLGSSLYEVQNKIWDESLHRTQFSY